MFLISDFGLMVQRVANLLAFLDTVKLPMGCTSITFIVVASSGSRTSQLHTQISSLDYALKTIVGLNLQMDTHVLFMPSAFTLLQL